MTLEEAKQKIIDKVLSLKTGWTVSHLDVFNLSVTTHYSHKTLPEEFTLVLEENPRYDLRQVQVTLGTNHFLPEGNQAELLELVETIRQQAEEEKLKQKEEAFISFAESLSN